MTDYDVIVVGMGPGGSMCARKCAELGLKTLVVEKRQEIGAPVRCGEGLSEHWRELSGIEYSPEWCKQEIHGAVLYAPSGKKIVIPTKAKGYVIERRIFEKKMAHRAIEAGAKVLIKTFVTDVLKEERVTKGGKGTFITGVVTDGPDGVKKYTSKIVIAADGVDSMTAKRAGIKSQNHPYEVDSGYQYEMAGLKFDHTDYIHLYFGVDVSPRGYVWIFPKGETIGNVGIGIDGTGKGGQTAKWYLDKFIKGHPEIFEKAAPVSVHGGSIPVGAPIEKPYTHGMLVVGDAAHMVNPIHGGGMGTSMEAATIAAELAKKAIDMNDISESVLSEYYDLWYEKRGKEMMQILKVRNFFERLSDDDLEAIADMAEKDLLLDLAAGKRFTAFIKVLTKKPKLAMLAAKTLR